MVEVDGIDKKEWNTISHGFTDGNIFQTSSYEIVCNNPELTPGELK